MAPHDENESATRGRRLERVIELVSLALLVTAVVQELRTPAGERRWPGPVVGFVPYDLRVPTLERVRARLWDPKAEHVIGPHVFGVGWTVNLGRVVELVRQRLSRER